MAMEGLRGYLQLASGLAETSRAKALEAASALLSLSSALSGGRSGPSVQVQVQDLAEELLAAAAANRRSLIALVRGEVERALANSPIPPDELDRARAAVAKLSADVEELRAQVLANPAVGEVVAKFGLTGHATSRPADTAAAATEASGVASSRPQSGEDGLVVDAALTAPVEELAAAPPRRRPPRKAVAGQAAATRKAATKMAPTETAATTKAATTKAATTKAATTKAATTKAATTKAATTKGATKKAATKKATKSASSSAAKKSTTTKSTAKKSAKSTAKKSTAKSAKPAPASSAGTS
jgi:hypothetical protein